MENGAGRIIYRSSLRVAVIAALVSLWLACGQAEAPTPTSIATPTKAPAATATPTKAVAATATPTKAPAAITTPTVGPVATPTPTLVATPTSVKPAAEKPQRGGTFRYIVQTDPLNFDLQQLAVSPAYAQASGKLYNSLLINYVEEEVECDVCSEWHLENNGKTMVFTLIPGIKFHTGQEMTSADVKYSLRMLMGDVDGIVSPRSGVIKEYIDSIETPSRYVVRINLVRPSAYVPKVLANANSVIYREGTTRADLKNAPAGSGPFKVASIVPGSQWAHERNPDYFKPGQPYLNRVELTVISDGTTQVAAVVTGRADIWQAPSSPAEQFLPMFYKLVDEGKLNVFDFVGGSSLDGTFMSNTKPPFNNLKIRQALNLAIDRTNMGLVTWGNLLKHPQLMVYAESSYWSTRTDKEIWNVVPGWGTGAKKAQEIEQAKQLVKDAGYPNGIDLDQMSSTGGGPSSDIPASEELQQELGKVGIRTKIFIVNAAQRAERLDKQTYSIFPYLLRQTTKDPDEIVGSNFITGAPRSYHGYSNPAVDKLFVQMSSELDPVKRKQILGQIVDIVVVQDVVYAPQQGIDSTNFWWKRLHGVTIGQTNHSPPGLMRGDRLWISE